MLALVLCNCHIACYTLDVRHACRHVSELLNEASCQGILNDVAAMFKLPSIYTVICMRVMIVSYRLIWQEEFLRVAFIQSGIFQHSLHGGNTKRVFHVPRNPSL
jgi:hypothetical protein